MRSRLQAEGLVLSSKERKDTTLNVLFHDQIIYDI